MHQSQSEAISVTYLSLSQRRSIQLPAADRSLLRVNSGRAQARHCIHLRAINTSVITTKELIITHRNYPFQPRIFLTSWNLSPARPIPLRASPQMLSEGPTTFPTLQIFLAAVRYPTTSLLIMPSHRNSGLLWFSPSIVSRGSK